MGFILAFGAMVLALTFGASSSVLHLKADQSSLYAQGGMYRQTVQGHNAAVAAYQQQYAAYQQAAANYQAQVNAANQQLQTLLANTSAAAQAMANIWLNTPIGYNGGGTNAGQLPPASMSIGQTSMFFCGSLICTNTPVATPYGTFTVSCDSAWGSYCGMTTVQQYAASLNQFNSYLTGLTGPQLTLAQNLAVTSGVLGYYQSAMNSAAASYNSCTSYFGSMSWAYCGSSQQALATAQANYQNAQAKYEPTLSSAGSAWLAAAGLQAPPVPPTPPAALPSGMAANT